MAKQPNDDLFAESTMSFGEHLEELRGSLTKALLGLLVGFLIGLALANYVVDFIQTPLVAALEQHHIDQSMEKLIAEYENRGEEIPRNIEDFIRERRFVFENVYVEAAEVARVQDHVQAHYESKSVSSPSDAETENPGSAASDKKEAASGSAQPEASEPNDSPATEDEPIILGEDIPSPLPVLVATRVWRPIETVVEALNAHEAFMIWLKAGFVAGLVIASPYMFWQLWLFVAAGLYPHEKKYIYIYLPFSLLLFLAGAGMAFFVVFDYVLNFLFSFNKAMNIEIAPRISEWLSFVLFLPLGFGVAFQLPLVMLFLHRIGVFGIKAYLDKWRIAVLAIFVISMLLTPADPISMLLMAGPLTFLYFLGIALCHWMPRNRSPYKEAYEP